MAGFTKKAILETFVELLNEQPFDKITVKDVVEKCGINRNTFYYYYQDIYALLVDLIEIELNTALKKTGDVSNWQSGITDALDFAIKNKKAVYHIYNSLNKDILVKYFRNITTELTTKFIDYVSGGEKIDKDDMEFLSGILVDASMGMVISWIEQGMTEDFEDKLKRVSYLFDGTVKEIVDRMKTKEYKMIKKGKA